MPFPSAPVFPTIPAGKAGAGPGQIVQRQIGQAAATQTARPSTGKLLYVRKTGSDTNGGSSNGTAPDRQGTDGVTNGTTTFTSVTGAFVAGDVNKLVMIGTKARYRITAVGGSTSVTLSGSPTAGSGLTWKIGGAVQTLAALLSTAAGFAPVGTVLGGDTIYIGAGVYREIGPTLPTPTFELVIEGDVTGAWTGDRGQVQLSAFLTDDRTTPSATAMFTLAAKGFLTFNKLVFVGGTQPLFTLSTTTQNLLLNDCAFLTNAGGVISDTVPLGQYRNTVFNRCYFFGQTAPFNLTATTGGGGHWDMGIQVRNSIFSGFGGSGIIAFTAGGALLGRGGGFQLLGCTFLGGNTAVSVGANMSTAIPVKVYGCAFLGMATGLSANAFGQIVEGQNFFMVATPRTNVGVGAGSWPGGPNVAVSQFAPLVHVGQEALWGAMPRAPGEPMVGSPILGFLSDNGGSDLLSRPRPAGEYSTARAGPAAGALQRGNTAVADANPIGAGTTPIQITGPGFEDFYVPVPARAITVSCSVKYSGSPAVLSVLANPTIGVRGVDVVEPSGIPNVVRTLTLPAFTPTAAGNMVVIRIANPDPSGTSTLEVDDFAVTG